MKDSQRFSVFVLIVSFIFIFHTYGQPYYVSNTGNDDNPGTIDKPFGTIAKAISLVQMGEIIIVRGDTFNLTNTISISKSGTASAMISLYAYPGERPVLNFSGQALGGSNRGIKLTGSYWHIKGFDITGAGDNGMKIEGGSYNIIQNCAFYRNRDSGLQIDKGASNNQIINCDSYFNADPPDYGDADGFAAKMDVGSGNYFYGCRAWKNCDDGWDGYLRGTDDVSNSAENCWAFENGYLEDGTDPGAQANGNGFKMGGSDDKLLRHNYTLKNCLAFKNKVKGFDQNNNKGSMTLYNCTGHRNLVANFRITQALADGKTLIVKNCASFEGSAEIGTFAEQEKNSWMAPFVVTADDFVSIDESAAYGPRNTDGSLPSITYMHLAAGSDLIDAGVDVGLPYAGDSPDLGCFEVGLTGFKVNQLITDIRLYPNPIIEKSNLQFYITSGGNCKIDLYDITGRYIKHFSDQNVQPGELKFIIDLSDVPKGIYFLHIAMNNSVPDILKLIKTN